MTRYISTRAGAPALDFDGVLMAGLASDGGLYVPESFPPYAAITRGSYMDVAKQVCAAFVGRPIDAVLEEAYGLRDDGFRHADIVPLHNVGGNLWSMELFYGPTLAFKDVALQLLGRLFDEQLKKNGQGITIVGATSGDTGSAAIEGCRHAAGAKIIILHPHGRTSDVQRRQMTTVAAHNVHNIALKGTFDDCQNIVKALFNDHEYKARHNLSAVNSINWARIMAQVVYYVHACQQFDRPVTFVVPTGNFGNIYAAYVAYRMGAPIKKLVVASNRNDILTRFFETGAMTASGVEPSLSPSMDIQISSNFERLLFELYERDGASVARLMDEFKTTGSFSVDAARLAKAFPLFAGHRCNDEQTLATIGQTYRDTGYMIDPHTAVGFSAAREYAAREDGPVVTLACAHPAKFPDAVERATGIRPALPGFLADLHERDEKFTVLDNDVALVKSFIDRL